MDQDKAYSPESNRLKSRDELAKIYSDLGEKTIVSYCNTGHWAATNWFVMSEILGQKNVKLYDGSMVEWTANTDLPLEHLANQICKRSRICFLVFWDNVEMPPRSMRKGGHDFSVSSADAMILFIVPALVKWCLCNLIIYVMVIYGCILCTAKKQNAHATGFMVFWRC